LGYPLRWGFQLWDWLWRREKEQFEWPWSLDLWEAETYIDFELHFTQYVYTSIHH
jgi:hypothetical protein